MWWGAGGDAMGGWKGKGRVGWVGSGMDVEGWLRGYWDGYVNTVMVT